MGFAARFGFALVAAGSCAAASAAGVGSNVRGAAGFGFAAAAVLAAPAFAVAVGFAAARDRPVLLPRRLPIRSGRALESDPSTPGSSFFAFDFCFLGLSAMRTRV